MDLALVDDAVSIVTVVAMDEKRQEHSNEEEDAVHDAKCPGRFQHGTLTIHI